MKRGREDRMVCHKCRLWVVLFVSTGIKVEADWSDHPTEVRACETARFSVRKIGLSLDGNFGMLDEELRHHFVDGSAEMRQFTRVSRKNKSCLIDERIFFPFSLSGFRGFGMRQDPWRWLQSRVS